MTIGVDRRRAATSPAGRVTPPAWLGLAFVLPSVAVFALFLVLPVVAVAAIATLEWAGFRIGDWTFVGARQVRQGRRAIPVFWRAFTEHGPVHRRDHDRAQHHRASGTRC